ncbi:MAG: hypothetical protein WD341_16290 [Tistlia sp.]|uniref:hypothetical protein n=1 Tax=Tistlia sp. TaxID=3057121 RepID=UPI0034A4396D
MTEADAGDSTAKAAREILAYLRVQPAAVDTARGVREWWLRGMQPPPTSEQVEAALALLAEAGQVRRRVNPDSTVLWSANDPDSDSDPGPDWA